MKGDFTRCKFDTKRHYNSVRMQQGRVLLDSDWNSQMEIESRLSKKFTEDIVGKWGSSLQNSGFAIISDKKDIKKYGDASVLEKDRSLDEKIRSLAAGDFIITKGRCYVEGILCENDEHTYGSEQQNCPMNVLKNINPVEDRDYLIYLDVWDRHITSAEDSDIREIALGGPDTTTRLETIWQVKAKICEDLPDDPEDKGRCSWHPARKNGFLRIKLGKVDAEGDLCRVEPLNKYSGQDNHLYRVEIHQGGNPRVEGQEAGSSSENAYATFKWSRDNGTPVYSVKFLDDTPALTGQKEEEMSTFLRVDVGAYPVQMLKKGDWVEIVSDDTDLSGKPGTFGQIRTIDESERIVCLPAEAEKHKTENNVRMRRWDGGSPQIIEVGEGKSFALENGILVEFSGDGFQAGDYWTFRARALTGEIDVCENPRLPEGIEHRFYDLAVMSLSNGRFSLKKDLRHIHLSLTQMTELIEGSIELSYVGGSGQEGRRGETLAYPLQVGVSGIRGPIAHAWIRFEVTEGEGHLERQKNLGNHQNVMEVETGENGVAECFWTLGHHGGHFKQVVKAELRDRKDLPVYFYAAIERDPNAVLRSEISQYGMAVGIIGILACIVGIEQTAMKWFAFALLIAFVFVLIVSIVIKERPRRRP